MDETSLFANMSERQAGSVENGEEPFNLSHVNSTVTPTAYSELYQVRLEFIVLLSLLYGAISLLALMGNVVVIWLIATSRGMHSATNCYIANLACADIIISIFSIPFQFQAALLQRWNLPYIMCPICPFFQVLSVNVSIFTLTVLAVDRYCAIINPLSHRPTLLTVKVIIACIWVFGGATSIPNLVALRVTSRRNAHTGESYPFCHNVGITEIIWSTYCNILVALQYFIPLVVISYAYLRISLVLWGAKTPGNAQGPRDATVLKNKKKVIKMLVVVVTLFAICWLPLQAYNVLNVIFPSINRYTFINVIWFSFHWLAMSNSCCNPFIYGIYNEKFKREFRSKFRRFYKNTGRLSTCNVDDSQSTSMKMSVRFHRKPGNWIQGSTLESQTSTL